MNQNGLTANTTTFNEITGNTTGNPQDSCLPLNGSDSGGNVSQYSIWFYNLNGVIFLFIFLIGTIGNVLVLYGFSKNKKLKQSKSNSYIKHLAITDLMFVLTLPIWAVDYFTRHKWYFGLIPCKAVRTISKINMYSSIFFLAALSVDRALAVTRPTTGTSMRTRTGIKIISISIWLCATLLALPETIYSTIVFQGNITACGMKFPIPSNATDDQIEDWYLKSGIYELLKCIFGFFGPICIILYSYSAILYTVQWKLIGGQNGKARATKLAAIIVTTFIICWLPFQALSLWSALAGYLEWGLTMSRCDHILHGKLMPYAVALAYANSAINPILYAFTLRPFRLTLNENLAKFISPTASRRGQEYGDETRDNRQTDHLIIRKDLCNALSNSVNTNSTTLSANQSEMANQNQSEMAKIQDQTSYS